MDSLPSVHGRRVWAKRVASLCGVSFIALVVAGCSSADQQRYGYYGAYGTTGSVPIPAEPVYGSGAGYGNAYGYSGYTSSSGYYGNPGYAGASGYSGYGGAYQPASAPRAPFAQGGYSDYAKTPVQRTALAPVSGYASDAGSSFAMQPVSDNTAASNGGVNGQRTAYDYRAKNGGYASDGRYDRRYDDDRGAPRYASGAMRSGEYEVEPGDTLYSIAQRFRLTTDELMELNGLRGPDIHPGQRLRVSRASGSAPAGQQDSPYDRGRYQDGERGYGGGNGRGHADDRGYGGRDYGSRNYDDGRGHNASRGSYNAERDAYDSRRDTYDSRRNGYGGRAAEDDGRDGGPARRDSYPERRRGYDAEASRDMKYRPPVSEYDGYGGRRSHAASTSYSVKSGDTMFDIARRNGISHRELADFNGLPVTAKLHPGQVLHIPRGRGYDWGSGRDDDGGRDESTNRRGQPRVSGGTPERAPERNAMAKAGPRTTRSTPVADIGPGPAKVEVTGGPGTRTAAASASQTQVVAAAHEESSGPAITGEAGKVAPRECESLLANPAQRTAKTFREPVQGAIVSKFGAKEDGSFNDGINFSVPKGTPVKAAENGVVAYAGDELAGFGNLVLVRHADGYVTAYANNDELMVKRCDVVKRGQTIGKAGATGNATKPQLHFELRKDSKPVDPEAFFSKS